MEPIIIKTNHHVHAPGLWLVKLFPKGMGVNNVDTSIHVY